jgi:tetratricopeptide (TPR) repeat protein
LHDLLREYARALAAAADAAAAGRLVNYYAHVAAAASKHIATWTTAGDYPAPIASYQQALPLLRRVGFEFDEADALSELGWVRRLTGDYPAAAASVAEAIELFDDLGSRHDLAMALNSLGELSLRTEATPEARRHGQALAIAREVGAPLEEARAMEGIGRSLLRGPGRSRHAPAARAGDLSGHRISPRPERPGHARRL